MDLKIIVKIGVLLTIWDRCTKFLWKIKEILTTHSQTYRDRLASILRCMKLRWMIPGTYHTRGFIQGMMCPVNLTIKGSRQPERRGVRNVSNDPNLARTAAIDVLFFINLAVIFDFMYFHFRPSKAKSLGNVLTNRQNAAKRAQEICWRIKVGYTCAAPIHILTPRCLLRQ